MVEGLAEELKPLYVLQKDFNAGELVTQVSRAESLTEDAEFSHRQATIRSCSHSWAGGTGGGVRAPGPQWQEM